eukprot:2541675-Rhodomonas_salina.1
MATFFTIFRASMLLVPSISSRLDKASDAALALPRSCMDRANSVAFASSFANPLTLPRESSRSLSDVRRSIDSVSASADFAFKESCSARFSAHKTFSRCLDSLSSASCVSQRCSIVRKPFLISSICPPISLSSDAPISSLARADASGHLSPHPSPAAAYLYATASLLACAPTLPSLPRCAPAPTPRQP